MIKQFPEDIVIDTTVSGHVSITDYRVEEAVDAIYLEQEFLLELIDRLTQVASALGLKGR